MLNFWFSRYDTICADNYIYFGSSCWLVSQCEAGVVSVRRNVHQGGPCQRGSVAQGCASVSALTQLGNESHTIYVLCLPSERGMGMSVYLAVPVSSGSTAGRACPLLQLCICRDVLHSHVTSSTIDATPLSCPLLFVGSLH